MGRKFLSRTCNHTRCRRRREISNMTTPLTPVETRSICERLGYHGHKSNPAEMWRIQHHKPQGIQQSPGAKNRVCACGRLARWSMGRDPECDRCRRLRLEAERGTKGVGV